MPRSSKNVCDLCAGRGFTIVGDRPVDCQCIRERRKSEAFDAIGIPRHLRSLDLESFTVKQDAAGGDNYKEAEKQKTVARSLVAQYCKQVGECIKNGTAFLLDPSLAYESADGGESKKAVESEEPSEAAEAEEAAEAAEDKGAVEEPDASNKQKPLVSRGAWSGSWIVLSGPRSSGKSMLASIMAMAAAKAGAFPKMLQWADIIESCYDFDRSSGNLYSRMSSIFARCSPIIIENVDSAYEIKGGFSTGPSLSPMTKLRLDVLFGPINAESKPVIFTTSRKVDEISKATNSLGPVLGSILEASAVIELPGRNKEFEMTVLNRGGGKS